MVLLQHVDGIGFLLGLLSHSRGPPFVNRLPALLLGLPVSPIGRHL
jgi:hypothetical protein